MDEEGAQTTLSMNPRNNIGQLTLNLTKQPHRVECPVRPIIEALESWYPSPEVLGVNVPRKDLDE